MPAHDSGKPVLEEWQRSLGTYEDHLAKLDVAMKAEVVQDLREVLSANRRNQQRVEDELMGGKNGEEDMGDILIDSPTNHYHQAPAPQAAGWSQWIAPALTALGLGTGAFALGLAANKSPVPQLGPVDSSYKVLFYDAQGNPITVPHISTKPK